MAAFGNLKEGKLARYAGYVGTAITAHQIYTGWKVNRSQKITYTLSVEEGDNLYDALHAWALSKMPQEEQKSLEVYTLDNLEQGVLAAWDGDEDDYPSEEPRDVRLGFRWSTSHTATTEIEGHEVTVQIKEPEVTAPQGTPEERGFAMTYGSLHRSITFSAISLEGRNACLRLMESMVPKQEVRRRPRVYMPRYSHWDQRLHLPLRDLDTVVIPEKDKVAILSEMNKFLEAEQLYADLGLPWHRGYLFSGPPGTGKTSLARALASHYGMNVYYLSLSDTKQDDELISLVASVPARSMLLIEDIDIACAATERTDQASGATLAGLLNVLDGFATPHGLITVMTTNHIKRLDEALLRPGRTDHTLEIGYLAKPELRALVKMATGKELPSRLYREGLTAAQVLEWAKRDLPDRDAAFKSISENLRQNPLTS